MKMQDDVYTPLQRWHKQYKHIKVAAQLPQRHHLLSAPSSLQGAHQLSCNHKWGLTDQLWSSPLYE